MIQKLRLLLLLVVFTLYNCDSDDITTPVVQENPDIEEQDNSEEEQDNSEEDKSAEVNTVDGIKIGPNYVVFEPEVTKSELGLWVKRKKGETNYHVVSGTEIDAINENYIEFTGNNLNGGSPKSPLSYTFKSPKSAKFRLVMRMYQPLNDGEAGDKRNDLWIKLDGDYTTACVYPTEELKKNHKFWGRGVRKWGSIHRLEGHVNGKKTLAKVVYNLKKDQEYTLTVSGRAQGCSIDYILFYEESLESTEKFTVETHTDLAAELPEFLRPD